MDKNSRVARLLEIEREKQKALFAMSGDIIFDYDVEKDLIIFSDEYKKVFGGECVVTNARAAMGSSMVILPEDLQELRDLTHALTEENSGYVKDVRLIDKFGEEKWYRLHVNSIWDKEHYGVMLSIVGRMISIDKMKREIGLWKRQAESDALTKLGNRAYGERLLQQLLCEPQKEKAAVMFLDVDNFKMVNDRHGHLFGDEVLCRIANEICRQFRSNDIVCRIGGDEFLIIMQNVRDSDLALLKADDLRAGIERLGREADIQVPLSVSVGVSFYPVDGTDEKTLLYKADKALYEAKKRGKNNCVIYGKELEAEPFMSQITVAESE
ncbi:MAG: sensor domain-containing diguanylate cyclase [Acidaminococcaceae bacterium]|nr:sensor domain-containing diguanylate cyclase [Acidaminococcaceae bacterium]